MSKRKFLCPLLTLAVSGTIFLAPVGLANASETGQPAVTADVKIVTPEAPVFTPDHCGGDWKLDLPKSDAYEYRRTDGDGTTTPNPPGGGIAMPDLPTEVPDPSGTNDGETGGAARINTARMFASPMMKLAKQVNATGKTAVSKTVIKVEAVAKPGYKFADGAQTSWTFVNDPELCATTPAKDTYLEEDGARPAEAPGNYVRVTVVPGVQATDNTEKVFYVNPDKQVTLPVDEPTGKTDGDKTYVFNGWDKPVTAKFSEGDVVKAAYLTQVSPIEPKLVRPNCAPGDAKPTDFKLSTEPGEGYTYVFDVNFRKGNPGNIDPSSDVEKQKVGESKELIPFEAKAVAVAKEGYVFAPGAKTEWVWNVDLPMCAMAPTIEVSDKTITAGDAFDPVKDMVTDSAGGEVKVEAPEGFDAAKPGEYTFTFTITNEGGTATKTAKLTVKAKVAAPTLEVSDKTITAGDEFDPMSMVTDHSGGDVKIDNASEVKTDTAGVYDVKFSVTNESGTATKTAKLTVKAKVAAPTLEVSDKTITAGDAFDPVKDMVTDSAGGEVKVEAPEGFDANKPGEYEFT
ncbi:hypothetical protein HMPREF9306_01255, partial [Propionimicrobium lymphophilum ACS-093-V-SCH5]